MRTFLFIVRPLLCHQLINGLVGLAKRKEYNSFTCLNVLGSYFSKNQPLSLNHIFSLDDAAVAIRRQEMSRK